MKTSFQTLLNRLRNLSTNEMYLPGDNEYKQRIDNYKKSNQQKLNWKKFRFRLQIGINRSNRMNPYKDIRKSYLDTSKEY